MNVSTKNRTTIQIKVEHLHSGCLVDLDSCPYLNSHASAAFEYARVMSVEIESAECVSVDFEGIDCVGYPAGTVLTAVPAGVPDPVVRVRQGASAEDWSEWRISQNLTDRWGDINDYEAEKKPLQPLMDDSELLERLRAQMWSEECFVVRKDGVFGVLLEVEYCSRKSEGEDTEYKPHKDVVEILLAGIDKLRAQYPMVLFAVPEEVHIMHERPAVWAYVADGLLNTEAMEALGAALVNL